MKFSEIKQDLFKIDESYQLVHCISSDAKMGAGIAVQFKKKFKLRILEEIANDGQLKVGSCHWVDRTLNLITKERYWHKPTYESFTKAVVAMRDLCTTEGIYKIAMPRIGCGLDKLQWGRVQEIIKDAFTDTDIEIVVCNI